MEASGRLIHILPAQTGTGKNGAWKKCDFVIETSDKYPKKICISAWNELSDQIENTAIGSDLQVSFDISSREYNGRWYTDVKAWKVSGGNKVNNSSNTATSTESAPPDFPSIESADDLPF
ncbi:MAG: DUF3127 domain-containing protein [Chitinophagales bacterium]|nr:DUF3127 domain-containing protein [Chitinophagales bacterium]